MTTVYSSYDGYFQQDNALTLTTIKHELRIIINNHVSDFKGLQMYLC